jgi:glycosyltransferase involved in cell wall biosynthesis
MDQKPMVSVVMITYNHEKYISEAMNGVLMQKCDFNIEFIIANDKSTDTTNRVINEIIDQTTIPDHIKLRYYNHLNNKGMMKNFVWGLEQAKGYYIALCDGDDYWTDPLKLQKQVDFLEANPDYEVCSHNIRRRDENQNKLFPIKNKMEEDTIISQDQLKKGFYLQTLTLVFRNITDRIPSSKFKFSNGDSFLLSVLGKFGKAIIISSIKPGVYRIHDTGIWSSLKNQKQKKKVSKYYLYKELIKIHEEDKEVVKYYKERIKVLSKNMISYIPKSNFIKVIFYTNIFIKEHNILKDFKMYKKYFKYISIYLLIKLKLKHSS